MSRAPVVFESMFGNTAEVARAEAWGDELGVALAAALRGAR